MGVRICVSFALAAMPTVLHVLGAGHELRIDGPVLAAEEGLLLGNGDLSASAYQTSDEIVFRFGKGDVWDRRLDLSTSPKPVTHDEYVRGILDEGWILDNYNSANTKATKGTKDEKRMKEACLGCSPSYRQFPYPCPKPAGEIRIHVPADMPGPPTIVQRLLMEEGRALFEYKWRNGVALELEATIAPDENVFSAAWRVTGLDDAKRTGRMPPVWCSLVRRRDEDPRVFAAKRALDCRHESAWRSWTSGALKPLPPPSAFGHHPTEPFGVEQTFYPDLTFKDGFKYRMYILAEPGAGGFCHPGRPHLPDAAVVWMPPGQNVSGEIAVAVKTSSDATLDSPKKKPHAAYIAASKSAAARRWARSALSIPGDEWLEKIWYATCHARDCILRGGTVPPGLFFPSSLPDYSMWHGDYHANYNYQSIYWGDYTANRLEDARASFECVKWLMMAGRLRASRYYGMRGAFVPLEGYPLVPPDDYNGTIALGRLVYTTGWTVTRVWEYYLYTLDRDWLEKEGYPVMRDCALFYLDFLKKAPSKDLPPELDDGLYHAFPSIEEETAVRSVKDVLDRPQVVANVRHCLAVAIRAAETLGKDADLRGQWKERLENLAGVRRNLSGYEKHCALANPPEFGFETPPYKAPPEWKGAPRQARAGFYFGHSVRSRITDLRTNRFIFGRDFNEYRQSLEAWARPNGLVWGMCVSTYGRCGGWTETLSCMAPLQEMLLQSWDGAIRLFPYWPRERDVAFKSFRAQGAFLVSAKVSHGKLEPVRVESEKGARCLIHGNWHVLGPDGQPVATSRDEFGRLAFHTVAGGVYVLTEEE